MTEPAFEDDETPSYSLEEQRRIDALDRAGRVQYNGIDDLLDAAVKVEKFLATGKVKDHDPTE